MTNNSKDKKPAKSVVEADDFESVANRLGCDDDKAAFEKKLGRIASAQKEAKNDRKSR